MVILYIIITLLILTILIISSALYFFIKKNVYLSEKEKEFIDFTITMYVDYGEEIQINSKEQHDIIVKELEKIRKKITTDGRK